MLKQGLLGSYQYQGRQGVLEYLNAAGCIQFDPIDVCGKNPELALQSRVKGFRKQMLYDLLYKERAAVDYFDKQLSIFPVENWNCYRRTREQFRRRFACRKELQAAFEMVRKAAMQQPSVCSRDLPLGEKVDWWWAPTKLSRAALESLYFCGELVIHHKEGSLKYYTLAENCIPSSVLQAPEPFEREEDYFAWRVRQRIGAVGLLWNRASDAFLGIEGLKSAVRERAFERLLSQKAVVPVLVEGIGDPFYLLASDIPLLKEACSPRVFRGRTELIAPLDGMMWDRKLILELFGFSYKWEIYTPAAQRKYGYYVLPMVDGERFAGRVEIVCNRKESVLEVKNIWLEQGVRDSMRLKTSMVRCFERFRRFHGMNTMALPGCQQSIS